MGPFDRFNDRAKRVLALAQDEAIRFNHNYIGLEKVRHQVIATLGQQHPGTDMAAAASAGVGTPAGAVHMARSHPTASVDRFDGSSQRALARAYWEAGRANDKEVAPHHLLRGLLAGEDLWVQKILTQLGVDLSSLVATIDTAAPRSDGPEPASLVEAPTLSEIFARAGLFAAERNR